MYNKRLPVLLLCALFSTLVVARRLSSTTTTVESYNRTIWEDHLPRFEPVQAIRVKGPNVFPKPSRLAQLQNPDQRIVPYASPTYGQHRPDQDAVIAYAAEYSLTTFVTFCQSLRNTGFDGDIVLAVSKMDVKKQDILDFLTSTPGVVVYLPNYVCFNFEQEQVDSAKGGIRLCQCHDFYGIYDETTNTTTPLSDPRGQRVIATIRYELYWIMVQHYQADSWILLIDARDTYFQRNPFESLPRKTMDASETRQSGLLYFFGENMEATRIGQSTANAKWIRNTYGEFVLSHLQEKPTVCSGATLGQAVALEAYARAMVAEADSTEVVLMGVDQGFHNFLYYSSKLINCEAIRSITVFDQGTSLVNHMGALRTAPLDSWGHGSLVHLVNDGSDYVVYNWDNVTVSPVIHQFDRHKELSNYFFKVKGASLIDEWRATRGK